MFKHTRTHTAGPPVDVVVEIQAATMTFDKIQATNYRNSPTWEANGLSSNWSYSCRSIDVLHGDCLICRLSGEDLTASSSSLFQFYRGKFRQLVIYLIFSKFYFKYSNLTLLRIAKDLL